MHLCKLNSLLTNFGFSLKKEKKCLPEAGLKPHTFKIPASAKIARLLFCIYSVVQKHLNTDSGVDNNDLKNLFL